ncbi:MAG: O-antigen ligase family protein [Chloroflexi bacterium]|nr:O-antigen ligase family protein [Chloroflexota bacterium]
MTNRVPHSLLWLIYLYPASLPFYGFSFFNLDERGLARPDWLIGGAIIILFGLTLATHRYQLRRSPVSKFVALFAYMGLLSAVNLFDSSNSQLTDFFTLAAQLLLVTTLFLVVCSLPLREEELRVIVRMWILTALATSMYAMYQVFARPFNLPLAYLELTNPTIAQGGMTARTILGYTQVSSVFREPSYFASFLAGPLVLLGTTLIVRNSGGLPFRTRWLNWVALATIAAALLLSGAQGALISLSLTLMVMWASGLVRRSKVFGLLLLIAVLLATAVGLLSALGIDFFGASLYRLQGLAASIADPANTPQVTSFANRYDRTVAALSVWAAHPVLGVGLGNMDYYTDVSPWSNNPWAQVLVNQGLLGLLPLVLVFSVLLRGLKRLTRSLPEFSGSRALAMGMFFVLVLDIFDGMFTLGWEHPQRWFTLTLANLVWLSLQRRAAEEPRMNSEHAPGQQLLAAHTVPQKV